MIAGGDAAAAPAPRRLRPLRRAAPTGHTRRWPLRRVFAVGAWVTAILAVLAMGLGALVLYNLVDARAVGVEVVTPARTAGQQLSVGLLDQETGVRGFALSARPEFLEPYRRGLVAEQEAMTALRRLATRTPLENLVPSLDGLDRAVAAWRVGYADPAVAGRPTDPLVGRALFDQVRGALGAVIADIDEEQAAVRMRIDDAAGFVVAVAVGVAVALATFLVAVGLGLRRGVLGPVAQLAGQVRDVVSGELQRPVRTDGPREIVELAADVEAMRVHIQGELDRQQGINRRLDEQARDLERSNRDLEQFAYVASHDLQEPLRKVSSFCQLLQRRYGGQLDERAEQYIAFAVDGAQRMQRLINDLLAFSRVGRTSDSFEPVALGDVTAAALTQLETTRAEAGGRIVVGELPDVSGDPALLRQLLVNLIGNGLKFHREDVAPVVRVEAERRDGAWEVTVADNGIGIEPEYADKVFVIFQRLHGRDRYPGTGIGLALAKKIVEFHGGRIHLDPPRDTPGTTVRFTLPALESE